MLRVVRSALCAADTGIVVILPVMDVSHVFLVDGSRAAHYACAPRDVLDRSVRALAMNVNAPPIEGREKEAAALVATAARALSQDLLPDASARARIASWKAVYVVGAELLAICRRELDPQRRA
jgi:hypothetical protein